MTLPAAAEWDAAERHSHLVAATWHASAALAPIHAAFSGLDPHDTDHVGDAAVALLSDAAWITPLLAPLVAALANDPWFEPPFRVTRDRLRTTVQLLDVPAGTLSATVFDGAALAAASPATLVASARLVVARYHVAGRARLCRWSVGDDLTALPPLALGDGDVHRIDGRTHAHVLEGSGGEVVAITFATRTNGLVREYDRATGRLIRIATTDETESRTRLLLSLLRVEGRRDAAPAFADATHAPAFHLRWTAMREWLALDPAAALPRLHELAADDPHPDVRAAAQATLPLVEAHLCRG